MHIIICVIMKFNGPNQVFESYHIEVPGSTLSPALKIKPSKKVKSVKDHERKRQM